MRQKIAQEWVTALRSGEYKQGQARLRTDDKYCCLGVLCDLYNKATGSQWTLDYVDDNGSDIYAIKDDQYNIITVAPKVKEWSGIGTDTGVLPPEMFAVGTGQVTTLASLNDHTNLTFAQIADVIEYFSIEL